MAILVTTCNRYMSRGWAKPKPTPRHTSLPLSWRCLPQTLEDLRRQHFSPARCRLTRANPFKELDLSALRLSHQLQARRDRHHQSVCLGPWGGRSRGGQNKHPRQESKQKVIHGRISMAGQVNASKSPRCSPKNIFQAGSRESNPRHKPSAAIRLTGKQNRTPRLGTIRKRLGTVPKTTSQHRLINPARCQPIPLVAVAI